ncbi:class I SAM-dependent methyltransferase [Paraburkholderia sp. BCC1885]|uniref:class I SAM-dependent methyltransferase n=1 Tax=Paraburkholderia sp. BCC1885 TaxID=2562669 RepID=UPI0011840307|nr:class I SAM-dependent methyltransferase [Paraburkholderia sp. BCC1885]
MQTLIDQDIAHIMRVMKPSLCGDFGGPILPAEYWRKRLYDLLDAHHVTKTQLCSIDDLLLELDEIDAAILNAKAVAVT